LEVLTRNEGKEFVAYFAAEGRNLARLVGFGHEKTSKGEFVPQIVGNRRIHRPRVAVALRLSDAEEPLDHGEVPWQLQLHAFEGTVRASKSAHHFQRHR
jgi:hypothetical protein